MAPHYVGASRGFSIKFSLRLPDCERDSSFLCSLRSDGPFHNIPIPLSLSLSLSLSGFQRVSYPVGSVRLGLFVFFFYLVFYFGISWAVSDLFFFVSISDWFFFHSSFSFFLFFFVGAGSEVMPGLMGRRRVGNLWMDSFFFIFLFLFFLEALTSDVERSDVRLRRRRASPFTASAGETGRHFLLFFLFYFFFAGGFYRR